MQVAIKSFLERSKLRSSPLYMDTSHHCSNNLNNNLTFCCWCCQNSDGSSSSKNEEKHDEGYSSAKTDWTSSSFQYKDEVYKQAAKEYLIDCTYYKLSNDTHHAKHLEIGYSTHLNLAPVVRIGCGNCDQCNNVVLDMKEWNELLRWYSYVELQFFRSQEIENKIDWSNVNEEDIIYDQHYESLSSNLGIYYNWELIKGYDRILKTVMIENYKCCSCTFNSHSIEELFNLKDIVSYRLEFLESYNLVCFYEKFIQQVVDYRRFREKEFSGGDDDIYKDIDDVINAKYNINSHNTVCLMEILYYRPAYLMYNIY